MCVRERDEEREKIKIVSIIIIIIIIIIIVSLRAAARCFIFPREISNFSQNQHQHHPWRVEKKTRATTDDYNDHQRETLSPRAIATHFCASLPVRVVHFFEKTEKKREKRDTEKNVPKFPHPPRPRRNTPPGPSRDTPASIARPYRSAV